MTQFGLRVMKLKKISLIMGSGIKKPLAPELQYISVARKSIVANRDIKKGEKFTMENLAIKRPGTGIPPREFKNILGKKAKINIAQDSLLDHSLIDQQKYEADKRNFERNFTNTPDVVLCGITAL